MEEYSRIIIEQYCRTHNSAKGKRIARLLKMSYDMNAEPSEPDMMFLAEVINREKNEELCEALQDLDDFLCGCW